MEFQGHPLVSSDAHHELHATHTRGDVPMPPGAPLHAGMPKNMTPPIKGSRIGIWLCSVVAKKVASCCEGLTSSPNRLRFQRSGFVMCFRLDGLVQGSYSCVMCCLTPRVQVPNNHMLFIILTYVSTILKPRT